MSILAFQMPEKVVMEKADDFHGLFTFKPLEKGYGVTIGNALRRILLSSLEGYAITSIKIPGVVHEFSTIEGVVEDVTDIILNLKQVRFKKVHDAFDGKISVEIKNQSVFTAGDIAKFTSSFEVLNPELVICHIDETKNFEIELTIEKGRGYLPAEESKPKEQIFGVIPIDAIFSPIRRVTFEVVPTRVEQSTNYDNLIIDIETDGSITPVDSLASAGATLRSLVDLVATMSDAPMALELGELAGTGAGSPDLDLSIEDLDLSERPRNCLKRAQVNTVGELLLRSEEDLLNITNFGQKSLDEIKLKLDERGLSLRI